MSDDFIPDKPLWTTDDFEEMGWHDCRVYAWMLSDNYEFILDIDYIFQWIRPAEEENYFKFRVSPCTLIFENVYDLILNMEISVPFEITIQDITRKNPRKPSNAKFIGQNVEYEWTIETKQGDINLVSIGFKQYTRERPCLLNTQCIGIEKRKGISFSKSAFVCPPSA